MYKKKLGFGIVGCGTISGWHADAILNIPEAELIGATDTNEQARNGFTEKYKISAFTSVDELLSSKDIDIVCICTPSGLHAPIAVQVADAGKHIIIEKPMAISHTQIKDVIEACERNNVKAGVISQLRFLPAVEQLKKAVEQGLLGKIITSSLDMKFFRSSEYYSSSDWRGTWALDGGGALMNQGIHGIDLLLYVMGSVKSLSARMGTLARDIEVEDTACAVLEFENGALGVIQASTGVYPGAPRRLEVCGEKGTIVIEGNAIVVWEIENNKSLHVPDTRAESSQTYKNPKSFDIQGHIRQISDMVEAVLNNRKPFVDQYEGKKSVELILRIYELSKQYGVV